MPQDPYEELLKHIGAPTLHKQKLMKTIRGMLETTKVWEESIPEFARKIKKDIARDPPNPPDQEWEEKLNSLTHEAATQSMQNMQNDPFVVLHWATGDVISVVSLQTMFRGLWDRKVDKWWELPLETREKPLNLILEEVQTKNQLPSDGEVRHLRALVNKAGEKSWGLMKRSTAKLNRDERARQAERSQRAGSQTSDRGASSEA